MIKKYELLTKKEYRAPASCKYVWLQQYTLVKRGRQRSVILRFANDLGERIDKLTFTLVQLDASGAAIHSTPQQFAILVGLDSGISFEKEISVANNCVDIAIEVTKVRSCGNEYYQHNGEITVLTNADATENESISSKLLIPSKKIEKSGKGMRIAIALLGFVLVLAVNALIAILNTLS